MRKVIGHATIVFFIYVRVEKNKVMNALIPNKTFFPLPILRGWSMTIHSHIYKYTYL